MDAGSLAELTASIGKYVVLKPILFRVGENGAPMIAANSGS